MTVALAMCVRNEADVIERCLRGIRPLIDHWTIVDTGSTDETMEIVERVLGGIPGNLLEREWQGFGDSLTDLMRIARHTGDWVLRCDADMIVEWHPRFPEWLNGDPDPGVDAWICTLVSGDMRWGLPLIMRGNLEWRFREPMHAYLDGAGRNQRWLFPAERGGITFRPMQDGARGKGEGATRKFEEHIEVLNPKRLEGDPRSTFYVAQALRCLGRNDEAIGAYLERAAMTDGWDEERWYAAYQAAKLAEDVEGLFDVWRQRPHRHEPLTAAARLVAAREHTDRLFTEDVP